MLCFIVNFLMSSLFYSQLYYELQRNIVNYLPQLESKEKRTNDGSALKSNHLIMCLFTFFYFVAFMEIWASIRP